MIIKGADILNKVYLTGRLTRDVETRYSQSGMALARTGIAVDRPTKNKEVDFFNLAAFDKTAEILGKYCSKGTKILLEGHLRFSQYEDKLGNKKSSVDVIVDSFEFTEPKAASKKSDNDSDTATRSKDDWDGEPIDPNDTPF